jgi:hypothetical protein
LSAIFVKLKIKTTLAMQKHTLLFLSLIASFSFQLSAQLPSVQEAYITPVRL